MENPSKTWMISGYPPFSDKPPHMIRWYQMISDDHTWFQKVPVNSPCPCVPVQVQWRCVRGSCSLPCPLRWSGHASKRPTTSRCPGPWKVLGIGPNWTRLDPIGPLSKLYSKLWEAYGSLGEWCFLWRFLDLRGSTVFSIAFPARGSPSLQLLGAWERGGHQLVCAKIGPSKKWSFNHLQPLKPGYEMA